jgi:hypothetical protein
MAGLTEARGPDPKDSFWIWRQLVFRFLDRKTPQDIQAATAFVQMDQNDCTPSRMPLRTDLAMNSADRRGKM